MHKVIQLISNFLYNKNMWPFYESKCSLDELDEKPNHKKMSKFWKYTMRKMGVLQLALQLTIYTMQLIATFSKQFIFNYHATPS